MSRPGNKEIGRGKPGAGGECVCFQDKKDPEGGKKVSVWELRFTQVKQETPRGLLPIDVFNLNQGRDEIKRGKVSGRRLQTRERGEKSLDQPTVFTKGK